jgi:DNA-binding MarR family transcriptional regulator
MTGPSNSEYLGYQAWVLLHYAHDLIVKTEEDAFRRKGGVSYQQFLILLTMESFTRPATAVELSRLLQRNPNAISMILDRMEKSGLVKRVRSQLDRRLVHVLVTPAGRRKLEQAVGVGKELVQRIITGFSDEELQLLNHLLDKLASSAAADAGLQEKPSEIASENTRRVAHIFDKNRTKGSGFSENTSNVDLSARL